MPEGDRTDERNERGGGSNGIGLAVGVTIVSFLAILPFVSIVLLYVFITIYAIVRAIGPGAGENPIAIVVGFVLITTALVVILGVTINLIGRSLTPKKRRGKT